MFMSPAELARRGIVAGPVVTVEEIMVCGNVSWGPKVDEGAGENGGERDPEAPAAGKVKVEDAGDLNIEI